MDVEAFDFTTDRQISTEHLIDVCKYRQGTCCCRYIFYPRDKRDFYCVKRIPEIKEKLDGEILSMISQGDNCPGLPHEES